jgi:competence protein ComEA
MELIQALYNLMLPKVTVKPSRIKKIDANAATFIELKSHPYISSNVALSIVNYRNMHGKYTSVADLMKSELIDEALFYKIAPYFIVE